MTAKETEAPIIIDTIRDSADVQESKIANGVVREFKRKWLPLDRTKAAAILFTGSRKIEETLLIPYAAQYFWDHRKEGKGKVDEEAPLMDTGAGAAEVFRHQLRYRTVTGMDPRIQMMTMRPESRSDYIMNAILAGRLVLE